MIGSATSAPSNDHVPELIYAQFFPAAGTPATAAPVSCEQPAMTLISSKSPFAGPSSVPAGTIAGKSREGSPKSWSKRCDQLLLSGLYNCVVLASDSSARAIPERKKLNAS